MSNNTVEQKPSESARSPTAGTTWWSARPPIQPSTGAISSCLIAHPEMVISRDGPLYSPGRSAHHLKWYIKLSAGIRQTMKGASSSLSWIVVITWNN